MKWLEALKHQYETEPRNDLPRGLRLWLIPKEEEQKVAEKWFLKLLFVSVALLVAAAQTPYAFVIPAAMAFWYLAISFNLRKLAFWSFAVPPALGVFHFLSLLQQEVSARYRERFATLPADAVGEFVALTLIVSVAPLMFMFMATASRVVFAPRMFNFLINYQCSDPRLTEE